MLKMLKMMIVPDSPTYPACDSSHTATLLPPTTSVSLAAPPNNLPTFPLKIPSNPFLPSSNPSPATSSLTIFLQSGYHSAEGMICVLVEVRRGWEVPKMRRWVPKHSRAEETGMGWVGMLLVTAY